MARIEDFLVANMPSHLHNDVSRAGAGALERLKCSTTRSTGELRIVQVGDSVWIATTTSIPEGQKVLVLVYDWFGSLAAILHGLPPPPSAASKLPPPQYHTASC